MAVATRRFTLAEFLDIADALEAGGSHEVLELIGGRLVAYATPDNVHMRAAVAFALYLGDAQRAGYGQLGIPRRNVALDYAERGMQAVDVVEPDVFFVTRERVDILEARPVLAAPDIVVEILSGTTAAADLPGGDKFDAYERHGVRFYWLVDAEARTVTQYERRADRLVAAATLRPGDTLRCPLFPELGLRIDDVFPPAAGSE